MKLLIAIATYNEVENIEKLISEIHTQLPGQYVLVIDDNSPDGTGKKLELLQQKDPYLLTVHRSGKLGLGTAHVAMMEYTMTHGFEGLITMDADFSHNPSYLPTMVSLLNDNDFVIGSRYMAGGKSNYGPYRMLLSLTANFLARILTGIPLHECTTAYRGYKISLLQKLHPERLKSNGYSFFVESLFYVVQLTPKVKEFPILFEDRLFGKSKINKMEIFKSVLMLFKLFWKRITFQSGTIKISSSP